jgi:hypothetical protein
LLSTNSTTKDPRIKKTGHSLGILCAIMTRHLAGALLNYRHSKLLSLI